jgi:hypothetical protein
MRGLVVVLGAMEVMEVGAMAAGATEVVKKIFGPSIIVIFLKCRYSL